MTASAQTISALLLLAGCMLPFVHMARPRSTQLDLRVQLVTGGLVGVTCASFAAVYASSQS
jgi:hypothetical protein